MTTLGLAESYEAIKSGVVGFCSSCDVVRITGPDARTYLEGQLSQQITDLSPGEQRETLVLSPQGKIDSYGTICCRSDDAFVLVVEAGFGESTYERLRRFKLRTKAELSYEHLALVRLFGPKLNRSNVAELLTDGLVVEYSWPGLGGVDLVGSFDASRLLSDLHVPTGDDAAFEAARIEAGVPRLGRELDESTIPQEAGIVDRTVSFTKGCFTGQELVARLDARGSNVARRLRGVVVDTTLHDGEIALGAPLYVDEKRVGELSSVAFAPGRGAVVGLARVARSVQPPAEVVVVGVHDTAKAKVVALPIS